MVAGIAGVGAAFLVRVYLNDRDFLRERERIRDDYKYELASIYKIEPEEVTVDHLENVADRNPTLRQSIDRERLKRNLNNGASALASAVAFAAVIAFLPALLPAAAAVNATVIGTAASISLATMWPCRFIFGKALNAYFNVNKPTVSDRVLALHEKRSSGISPEQVMEVYIDNIPGMAEQIKKDYGKPFGQLKHEQQIKIEDKSGLEEEVKKVARLINNEEMNVKELTFRIHGQVSGRPPEKHFKTYVKEKVSAARQGLLRRKEVAMQKFGDMQQSFSHGISSRFRTMFGSKAQADSHVERLEAEGGRSPAQDTNIPWTSRDLSNSNGRNAALQKS
jgi:hypothetical protein